MKPGPLALWCALAPFPVALGAETSAAGPHVHPLTFLRAERGEHLRRVIGWIGDQVRRPGVELEVSLDRPCAHPRITGLQGVEQLVQWHLMRLGGASLPSARRAVAVLRL